MKTKISAFIIAFNEEKIIEKCLLKLDWVDEIIVVDSGSTDSTVAICEKHNAKVIYKKFNGYGEQKQFALDQTTHDWVLNLDADEVLTDAAIIEIKDQLENNDTDIVGLYIKTRMVFAGSIFKYGNERGRDSLRLFNKQFGKIDPVTIHESVVVNGKTKKLKGHYLHYTCDSLESYITKLNKYTGLYAENKYKRNKSYSILSIWIKVRFEFIKKYFIELNCLNGKAGFYWSYVSSVYTGVKCMKTNEQYILKK